VDGIDKLIDSVKRIIRKETEAYDTAATVRRIEGSTAWVHIDGGVDETPVKLTINAQPGDSVQVRVSGGKAFLVGNGSAPPTDDRVANYARTIATTAQTTAEDAQEAAEAVTGIATAASSNASAAITLAEGIDDHFWSDSAGAHITEDDQETYLQDPSAAGGNTLITSAGMAVRHGTTQLAAFTSTGAQIGQNANGQTRSVIGTSGMQITQKDSGGTDVDIANLGYGPGNDSGGGTSNAPYYTLGLRKSGSGIGNYSTAEGYETEASGFASHAEGYNTKASDVFSHAEGQSTTASGAISHAEGADTHATGNFSHAEGGSTTAGGDRSHAQNYFTKASSDYQTALGKYNVEDNTDTYAAIIGNGTADNARSNALTVDWSGNVDIPLGSKYMVGGVDWHCYGNYYGASSSLTLATTDKKVSLNTFSGSGCSSSSNGIKIDANHAGTYSISGAIYASTGYTANDIVHACIYKNSTLIGDAGKRVSNGSPYEIIPVGPLVATLAAGDVIYLYARNQSGARGTVANYGNTQTNVGLNIYRVG